MSNLTSVLNQLEQERARLAFSTRNLKQRTLCAERRKRNRAHSGTISTAGRARIAAAQRRTVAKAKGKKVVSIAAASAHVARCPQEDRRSPESALSKWRKQQKTA